MKLTKIICFFIFSLFSNSFTQNLWIQTNGPFGGTVEVLYTTKDKNIYAGTWKGLYISKDNGESWKKIFDKNINDIEETKDGIIFIGSSSVYYSIDKGQNWISINNGLRDISITDIKVSNKLLILSTALGGVYISKDSGDNWIPINSGLNNLEINAVSIKSNGNILICSDEGIFETADDNIKWVQLYTGRTKKVIPRNNNELFIITNKGIFYSNDNGNSWLEKNNGLKTLEVNDIAFISNNILLCGTEKSGIYKSDDNGFFWKTSNHGILNLWVNRISINSKGEIFVGSLGSGIFRSTDDGNSWVSINNGLRDFNIKDIEIGIDDEIFIGTSNGVYRSSNNGKYWQKVDLYLDDYDKNIRDIHLLSDKGFNKLLVGTFDGLAVSETPGIFYKRTFHYSVDIIWSFGKKLFLISSKNFSHQEIYQSNNYGETWFRINAGYEKLYFWTVKSDKYNNLYAGTNNGLIYSSDLGKNWSTIKSGFTQHFEWGQSTYSLVKALLVLNNGNLYSSFDGAGLYFSVEKGQNLILDNNGLPNSNFKDIKISPNGYIFVGTSSGLFRTKNKVK